MPLKKYTATWRLGKLTGTFQIEGEGFKEAYEYVITVDDLHPDAEIVGLRETSVREKKEAK